MVLNMYQFKKLEINDMHNLRKLYFQEEDIQMDVLQIQGYESKITNVYEQMMLRGSYIYGCFEKKNSRLIAAITVNKCLDCYPGYTDEPYIHLETFIVHKEYQNKGIGTQLITNVLEIIKEEGCTYIIMQSNNPAVQRIARKAGLSDSLTDMRIDFADN